MYAKWLEIVSVPATLVPPNVVERTDISFSSPINNTSWAGLALDRPSTRYIVALGGLYVPTMEPIGSGSGAAIWLGLGGVREALIQDGILFFSVGSMQFFEVFYQYYPFCPEISQTIRPLPGDSMVFFAWEGDASCTIGAGHTGYGCFWVEDQTQNNVIFEPPQPVLAPTPAQLASESCNNTPPAVNAFNGATAEAILEQVNNGPLPLWLNAQETVWANDSNNGTDDFANNPFQNYTLVNGSNQPLVTAQYSNSPDVVSFTWEASQ
jgi:hypothetical protein